MGNRTTQPLRLAVYGFDSRSRETLRLAFEGPGKGCGVLVDEATAEAGIFNMDSVNAEELWADYRRRFPERPAIIMAIKDPQMEGAIYVPKPVRIDAMIKAVFKARALMPQAPAEEEPVREEPAQAVAEEAPAAVASAAVAVATRGGSGAVEAPVAAPEEVAVAEPEPVRPEPPASEETSAPAAEEKAAPAAPEEAEAAPKPQEQEKREPEAGAKLAREARPARPAKRRETYYDPQELLQGRIQEALEQANRKYVAVQLDIQVDEEQWQSITFLPGVKRVLMTLSDEQLKHLCTMPLDLLTCRMKVHKGDETFNMIRKVTDEKTGQSLDVFLWKVAVWSSMGRLPVGTNLSKPVQLKHWPNLTRFYPIPNAMRIATLIIDQPRPLPLVIKVLNLPQTHVFAFYSAASAIGLVANNDEVGATPATQEQETPRKHKHHSLFGRILKRLRGNSGS